MIKQLKKDKSLLGNCVKALIIKYGEDRLIQTYGFRGIIEGQENRRINVLM